MMRVSAFLGMVVLAAGCATQPEIALDYDADHDFSGYETFAWMGDEPLTVEGGLLVPTIALTSVEQAVRDELLAKGFVAVQDRSEADFGVSIVLSRSEAVVFDSADRSVYAASERSAYDVDRPGRRRDSVVVTRSGYGDVELDPLARNVVEGKLSIGVHELGAGAVVWSVSAQRDISNAMPDGREADRAVQRLLRDFPPDGE